MCRRHQPGRTVEGGTEVITVPFLDFAGMYADASSETAHIGKAGAVHSPLVLRGSLDRIGGRFEDSYEAVTRVLEDRPSCRIHNLLGHVVVLGQGGAHRLWMLVPEARRSDYVGEQETCRGHGRSVATPGSPIRGRPISERSGCQRGSEGYRDVPVECFGDGTAVLGLLG